VISAKSVQVMETIAVLHFIAVIVVVECKPLFN
jgi:hypothetical protein